MNQERRRASDALAVVLRAVVSRVGCAVWAPPGPLRGGLPCHPGPS